MLFFIFLLSQILSTNLYSQDFKAIDTVYSFTPGNGQNNGQDTTYFPENIFGLPSDVVNADIQEVRPEELLSLGLGGEITVGIKNMNIYNIQGPDFIIYENVFRNPFRDVYFAEPAIVSVSYDGEEYIEFPYDSLTLEGCAGTKPTLTKDKEYDPYNCGGDAFDLDDIFMDEIKYIKIRDITEMIIDNPQHKYYDPTLSGFDLDAVIITGIKKHTSVRDKNQNIIINSSEFFSLDTKNRGSFYVYNLSGKMIYSKTDSDNFIISKSNLHGGIYFVIFIDKQEISRYRFIN